MLQRAPSVGRASVFRTLGNVVKEYPLTAGWSGDLNNEAQQLFWKS